MADMMQLTMVLHTLCNCMREIDGVAQGIPPNIRVALPGGGQRIFAHRSSDPPYHHYQEVVEESQAFKPPVRIHTLDPVDEKLREDAFESTKAMRDRLKAAEPQLTPQQAADVKMAIDAHLAGLTKLKPGPDPVPSGAFTKAMAQQAANQIQQQQYQRQYMAQPRYEPSSITDPHVDVMQRVIDELAEDHKVELYACTTDAERVAMMRRLLASWLDDAAGRLRNE